MSPSPTAPPDVAQAAQAMLSAALGGDVRLDQGSALSGREHVFRFALLHKPPGAPDSVIVKQPRRVDDGLYNPDEPTQAVSHFFDDWAALQFLSAAAGDEPVAPRYLAGDRAQGLLAIEDLGSGEGIDSFLLGADPGAAEEALLALARTLGRMHARTIGRRDEYLRIRGALGPHNSDARTADNNALPSKLLEGLATLDVAAPPGLEDDLAATLESIAGNGPFLAYTHGDPCPDNCLRVNGRIRLIDFEVGAFRHALTDGVYGRIHFPTCWCVNRLPDQIPLRMEAAYRAELAQGCPAAADDQLFRRATVEACAFWCLRMCAWPGIPKLLEEDRDWGIATLRQRMLLRLPIVARLAADVGHLEALGAAFGALAETLCARWEGNTATMPLYPAFRPAASDARSNP